MQKKINLAYGQVILLIQKNEESLIKFLYKFNSDSF